MYKSFDGFKQTYTPVIEGATDISTSIVQEQVNNVNNLGKTIHDGSNQIYSNYTNISQNVGFYDNMKKYLHSRNDRYHYDDTQNPQTLINNKPKDIFYAINSDMNELQLYQNSIYITGLIACGTLLIAAIFISKK